MDVKSISEGCAQDQGFAFNVTGTHKTPTGVEWTGGEACAAVASSIPVPNPCRTKVSPAAASSISASIVSQLCKGGTSLVNCPPEENSAPRAVVGSVVGLIVVLGALSPFLM